jgi:hypothetical protein
MPTKNALSIKIVAIRRNKQNFRWIKHIRTPKRNQENRPSPSSGDSGFVAFGSSRQILSSETSRAFINSNRPSGCANAGACSSEDSENMEVKVSQDALDK